MTRFEMTMDIRNKYKNIAILYHLKEAHQTPEDAVGHVATYAVATGSVVDYFFTPEYQFPETLEDYDLVFIMGGEGSVYGDVPDWMSKELTLLHHALERKQKMIGICLGAQMLAKLLGAEVRKNHYFEAGFHPVNFHQDEDNPVLKNIPKTEIFWHWHEDGFHTPEGAIEIASNTASHHEDYGKYGLGTQGFVTDNVMALQFHPEVTSDIIKETEKYMDESENKFKQSKDLMLLLAPIYSVSRDNMIENCARDVFFRLMDNFLMLV